MPRSWKKLNLPVGAVESLAADLTALSRRSSHVHSKPVERLAATYRSCSRTIDALPEARIRFVDPIHDDTIYFFNQDQNPRGLMEFAIGWPSIFV